MEVRAAVVGVCRIQLHGFGTQSANFTGCGGACVVNANAKADVQNVLAGVNYKFNF